MSDLTSNPVLPSDPSPRDLARQARIDTLRRAGYDEQRLAALEDQTPAPSVPDDLVTETIDQPLSQDVIDIMREAAANMEAARYMTEE